MFGSSIPPLTVLLAQAEEEHKQLDELSRLLNFPVDTLVSILLLIIVALQAYIALRIWRPKIEIFTQLEVVPSKQQTASGIEFVVANLSSIGIWVDRMEIIEMDPLSGKRGELHKVRVGIVVAASSKGRYICGRDLYAACAHRAIAQRVETTLRVRARYRALGKWRHTDWQRYYVNLKSYIAVDIKLWEDVEEDYRQRKTPKT